jgi:hypothetical protein
VSRRATLLSALTISLSLGCATAGQQGSGAKSAAKSNSDIITMAEIDSGTYRDAYDIVQRLRPNWFTKAKSASMGSLGGMQVSGSGGGMAGVQSGSSGGTLLVYLDNHRLGGPEALRDLTASAIKSLQFLDGPTASASLPGIGSTIVTGAIVATSRTGGP